MFVTAIVLLFILKIRYPASVPISDCICRRYGPETLRAFRKYEHNLKRHEKALLDSKFLHSCKSYNIFPKFLQFKLYKKSLHNSDAYKEFQGKLLDQEIKAKCKHVNTLSTLLQESQDSFKQQVSWLDFSALRFFLTRNLQKYCKTVSTTHSKKLHTLGGKLQLSSCSPDDVIFNYSNRILSTREKYLLSFGLHFGLPVYKPSFYRYFLHFEFLIHTVKSFQISPGHRFETLVSQIKRYAYSTYYGFKSHKVFSPIFNRKDLSLLRELGKDKSLIVCSPDKGREVVLLNRTDYINKMNAILSDGSKFKKITEKDPFRETIAHEDRINRFLNKLKDNSIISSQQYDNLYASGSAPGTLYGLPKVHKPDLPIRPILAAYKTASYKVAKYLLPLLEPITTNAYTLKNSYAFYSDITSFNSSNSFMVSFDIESLYTNIPVNETIDIVCNKLFSSNNSTYHGYNKAQFKQLLSLTIDNTAFTFNSTLYQQIDGLSMGNPSAPHLANIFLCTLEDNIMDQCPSEYKPKFYRRYLDDTFVIFDNENSANSFLNYINSLHSNINFTMEKEQDRRLAFLDVDVTRQDDGSFTTSVYRKSTNTGLATSFFSFIPYLYKINVIRTFIYRAYHLSSSYISFSEEVKRIEIMLTNNGYPLALIQKYVNKFLYSLKVPSMPVATVPRKVIYISLPYLGPPSHKLAKHLGNVLSSYYAHIDFKFSFKNKFQIQSFFPYKDKLHVDLQSNIIYKYRCDTCNGIYIGSSIKQSKIRFTQHLGISFRTNRHLGKPMQSTPRIHSESHNHPMSFNAFSIIDTAPNILSLRILEPMYLAKLKPSFNKEKSAEPLFIVE